MDVPDNKKGIIWACANAGLAIGALGFGLLVDVIGRKWAFNLTCLICSFFGIFLVRAHIDYLLGRSKLTLRPPSSSITEQSAVSTSLVS